LLEKGEGYYGGKDLWKRYEVLSLEWKRAGVIHSESSDYDDVEVM